MNDSGNPRRPEGPGRRRIVKGLGIAAGGLLAGGAGFVGEQAWQEKDPPTPASAASVDSWQPPGRQVDVLWAVDTAQRLVALTFDDGPMERWTPQALDTLDAEKVTATFFVVGSRLVRNARLVHDRLGRHEVGNHTWKHDDLSKMSHANAYRSIHRTHTAIKEITGREATLLRPPWGRLGGTTLHVAAEHGYDLALWSLLVQDRRYGDDPAGLVEAVVDNTRPGTIVLAHDVGAPSRKVAVQQLPAIIRGLRAKGFEFVTVSQLRQAASGRATPGTGHAAPITAPSPPSRP
ncbi:polysaccharide deacetylase family protein [Actinomadura rubrisoli]|uniref:Polysaccharide deacetylase family protein n=1 Tax=Actinomadura rubrisoli TaxID=2530368 RepID=A0A4R5B420_9ACTN|nr:polysaccharide deacetylase family protein [Actinomadura rubrisoli]TDD79713.1 polysaccharide deacetylase family protein [Actinomadura rubrisoli]